MIFSSISKLKFAVQYGEIPWTLWDRFDFRGNPTLQDLIDSFKDNHGLEIGMVSSGVSMLWSSWLNPKIVSSMPKFSPPSNPGNNILLEPGTTKDEI